MYTVRKEDRTHRVVQMRLYSKFILVGHQLSIHQLLDLRSRD